jgi:hypothetical protein
MSAPRRQESADPIGEPVGWTSTRAIVLRNCVLRKETTLSRLGLGSLIRRLRLSAESDQGKDERGEHGDTQDATKRIHPPQHLVASPPREGRRSEDDQDVACPALGVA